MNIDRRYRWLLGVIVILLLVAAFFVRVMYQITSQGVVVPEREWRFYRGQDDSYLSEIQHHAIGRVSDIRNYKFERGEVVAVEINQGLQEGSPVLRGDTIVIIHSPEIENEITRLRAERDVEESLLAEGEAGEKEELLEEALRQKELAEEEFSLAQKDFERIKTLYQDSVVPESEYDVALNRLETTRLNVELAGKRVSVLKSGLKPESLEVIRKRIKSYSDQIESLERMLRMYVITAPFNGKIVFQPDPVTLLSIYETNNWIIQIPVKVSDLPYLKSVNSVELDVPEGTINLEAKFLSTDATVQRSGKNQYITVRLAIEGSDLIPASGMAIRCRVICDEVTIINYLRRKMG
ncbi:MAG: hypothetical protein Kow00127_09610 [Bacteroidales bacterium]